MEIEDHLIQWHKKTLAWKSGNDDNYENNICEWHKNSKKTPKPYSIHEAIVQYVCGANKYKSNIVNHNLYIIPSETNTFDRIYKDLLEIMYKAPRPTQDITIYRYKSRPYICGKEVELVAGAKIPSIIPLSTSLSQGFVLAWQAKIKEGIEEQQSALQKYSKLHEQIKNGNSIITNDGKLVQKKTIENVINKLSDLKDIIPDDCCIYEIKINANTPCVLTGRLPDGNAFKLPDGTRNSISMYDEYEVVLPPGILTVTEVVTKREISEDDKEQWTKELETNKDNKGDYLIKWLENHRTLTLYKCTYEPFNKLHKVSVSNNLKDHTFKQTEIYQKLMSLLEGVKPFMLYEDPNYVPSTFIYHKDYLCNKDKFLQDIRDGVYGPPVLNDTGGVELIMFKAPDAYQQTAGAKPSKLQTLIQKHKEAVKEMLAAQKAYTQAVRKNKLSSSELKKLADKGFRAEAKAMKAFEAVKAAKRMGQK